MSLRRRVAALGILLLTLGLAVPPASAITGGEPDGGGHPNVGAILAFDPSRPRPLLCTGVLVHPRVVLTAGHCLHGFEQRGLAPADVVVRFDPDFEDPGATSRAVAQWLIHPDFTAASASTTPADRRSGGIPPRAKRRSSASLPGAPVVSATM